MATEHRIQLTGPELDERLAQVLTNEEDIGQEQQTRETTDEGMQEQLGALSTRMDAQDTTNEQVATDIENLQKAIGTGGSVDDKIAAAVGAEATAREAADTALQAQIDGIAVKDFIKGAIYNATGLINIDGNGVVSLKLFSLRGINAIEIDYNSPISAIKYNWYDSDGFYIGMDYFTNSKTIRVPEQAKDGFCGLAISGTDSPEAVFNAISSCNLFGQHTIDISEVKYAAKYKNGKPVFERHKVTDFTQTLLNPVTNESSASYNTYIERNSEDGKHNYLIYLKPFSADRVKIENYLPNLISFCFVTVAPAKGNNVSYAKYNGSSVLYMTTQLSESNLSMNVEEDVPNSAVCLLLYNYSFGVDDDVYISFYNDSEVSNNESRIDNIERALSSLKSLGMGKVSCIHWNIGHFSERGSLISDINAENYTEKHTEFNRINSFLRAGYPSIRTYNEASDYVGVNEDNTRVSLANWISEVNDVFKGPWNRYCYNMFQTKNFIVLGQSIQKYPASVLPHESDNNGITYHDDAYFIVNTLYMAPYSVYFILVHFPSGYADKCLKYILDNYGSKERCVIVGDYNYGADSVDTLISDYSGFTRYPNSVRTYEKDGNEMVLDHVVYKGVSITDFEVVDQLVRISDHYPIAFNIEAIRTINKVIRQDDLDTIYGKGTSGDKPSDAPNGMQYFDTTLNIPLYKSSTGWVNSEGGLVLTKHELTEVDGIIGTNSSVLNRWITTTPNKGALFDISEYAGGKLALILNDNGEGTIGFLKEAPTSSHLVVYAGNETTAIHPSSNVNIPIPDDAVYLYVYMKTSVGVDASPKGIILNKKFVDFEIS